MGPWEKYAQPNAAQGLGRPIIREAAPQPTPQTPEARANTVASTQRNTSTLPFDLRKAAADAVKAEMEAKQLREKMAAKQKDTQETVAEVLNVIDAAAQAHRMSRQRWTTGFDGAMASVFPGSPRKDIEGLLTTIGGNTAFSRLQKMREESPTGGALGQVAIPELEMLKGSIASLDPNQSDKKFQQSMSKVINSYGRVLGKLPGGKQAFKEWRKGFLAQNKKPQQAKPSVIDFNDLPE